MECSSTRHSSVTSQLVTRQRITRCLYGAAIVAHTDAYFVISGSFSIIDEDNRKLDKLSTTIGRLDYVTLQWSLAGRLVSNTKYRSGVIFEGMKYAIVGGGSNQDSEYNENCVVNDKMMTCTVPQGNEAISKYWRPILFLIDLEDDRI